MTFARSLLSLFALATVLALGACEKHPASTIESIENTLHHHGGHGGEESHGDHHGDTHGAKEGEKAAH